jgi:hypothetical protein
LNINERKDIKIRMAKSTRGGLRRENGKMKKTWEKKQRKKSWISQGTIPSSGLRLLDPHTGKKK